MFYRLIEGDCLKVLPTLEDSSVKSVITDPLTHLSNPEPFYSKFLNQCLRIGKSNLTIFSTVSVPRFQIYHPLLNSFLTKHFKHVKLLKTRQQSIICGSNDIIQLNSLENFDAYVPVRRRVHSAQRPLELIERLVTASSSVGDVVLDPFLGSGTTMCATKNLGRSCIGIEIRKDFCKIAKGFCENFPNFSFDVFK